jgi:hypothetical protein
LQMDLKAGRLIRLVVVAAAPVVFERSVWAEYLMLSGSSGCLLLLRSAVSENLRKKQDEHEF